jgi:hypothetical protein
LPRRGLASLSEASYGLDKTRPTKVREQTPFDLAV